MNTIVKFGPHDRLVGILSGASTSRKIPTLMLPNAGLVPRAGPFRLHAELAQRLAALGMQTFRFDVPGVGEAPHLDGFGAREAVRSAMDQLAASHGCTTFAVGGVCSAADLGWRTAMDDERVRAVLLLDGISFTGPWFHYARFIGVLRRAPREWIGLLVRLLSRLRQGGGPLRVDYYREWPDRSEARRQFAELVAREVRLLCVYTGGYSERFLHPRQFVWNFGPAARDPRVTLRYWPDCDHTFFARDHRERLLDIIEEWLANDAGTGKVK